MRFLLVTYLRKPNGQIDEQIGFSTRTRERDLTTCNVIIDYKDKRVIKCHVGNDTIPTTFEKLTEYYQTHYPDLIAQLKKSNE